MKSSASISLAVALAAIPMAMTVPMGSSAVAQRWAGVDGRNVTTAYFDRGRYQETSPGQWVEYNAAGRATFFFRETNRDDWSVYLYDRSRNVRIQIDIHRGWIRYAPGGGTYSDLYQIVRAERRGGGGRPGWRDRDGRGPGWRDRDDRRPGNVGGTRAVEAGPIWNQRDAEVKCRRLAARERGEWTGQWWTTQQGRMSVCQIRYGGRGRDVYRAPVTRDVEAGPIWNQQDAEVKCRRLATRERGEWTGQWRTTQVGRMSVCQIRFR